MADWDYYSADVLASADEEASRGAVLVTSGGPGSAEGQVTKGRVAALREIDQSSSGA